MTGTTAGWMCMECGQAQELGNKFSFCCGVRRPETVSARAQATAQPKTPPRATAEELQKPVSPVEKPKTPITVVVPKSKTWDEVRPKRAHEEVLSDVGDDFTTVSYAKKRHLSNRVRSDEECERRRDERRRYREERRRRNLEKTPESAERVVQLMGGKRLAKQFVHQSGASPDASGSSAERRRTAHSPQLSPRAQEQARADTARLSAQFEAEMSSAKKKRILKQLNISEVMRKLSTPTAQQEAQGQADVQTPIVPTPQVEVHVQQEHEQAQQTRVPVQPQQELLQVSAQVPVIEQRRAQPHTGFQVLTDAERAVLWTTVVPMAVSVHVQESVQPCAQQPAQASVQAQPQQELEEPRAQAQLSQHQVEQERDEWRSHIELAQSTQAKQTRTWRVLIHTYSNFGKS